MLRCYELLDITDSLQQPFQFSIHDGLNEFVKNVHVLEISERSKSLCTIPDSGNFYPSVLPICTKSS